MSIMISRMISILSSVMISISLSLLPPLRPETSLSATGWSYRYDKNRILVRVTLASLSLCFLELVEMQRTFETIIRDTRTNKPLEYKTKKHLRTLTV